MSDNSITHSYRYLLVGGGMAADAAVRGIRQVDLDGTIGLISSEKQPPYNRPPLSKGLWKGMRIERIWRQTETLGAVLHLGRTVTQIDPLSQQVWDDSGQVYHYETLLLATGGTPIHLPSDDDGIIYFRTVDDYLRLRELAAGKKRFAVIGGGFIGSEIASVLTGQGCPVTMIFLENGVGGRIFPADLSSAVTRDFEQHGVQILPGQSVDKIEHQDAEFILHTSAGQRLQVDAIVAGLGIRPNVDLARQAGLKVENGIVVDQTLRTSDAHIFAAGDCISFFNPALGERLRVEHEEHANQSGLLAGQSMAGLPVDYTLLPSAYSKIFDFNYESVGILDVRLTTVAEWQEPYRKGVLYYLQQDRLRGVLLWNLPGKLQTARELISAGSLYSPADLNGLIR